MQSWLLAFKERVYQFLIIPMDLRIAVTTSADILQSVAV